MTITSQPRKNKQGRVGVKRRRLTTNQALRARVSELETQLATYAESTVPRTTYDRAVACIAGIFTLTEKSRTGVAKKAHEAAAAFSKDELKGY